MSHRLWSNKSDLTFQDLIKNLSKLFLCLGDLMNVHDAEVFVICVTLSSVPLVQTMKSRLMIPTKCSPLQWHLNKQSSWTCWSSLIVYILLFVVLLMWSFCWRNCITLISGFIFSLQALMVIMYCVRFMSENKISLVLHF